nr:hypothetical protein [Tanacetum cinerariifolium]
EADASLAKHKILELDFERLLKAVVCQDIISVVQNASVVDTSDLQTELERTKERFENCIIKKETEYAKLWNDWYKKENAHLKTTYKNLFDSISVSRVETETKIASLQNELQSNIYKNAKLRTQLFKKVSDQKDNTQDTSKNTKFAKQPIVEILPKIGETNALSKPVTSNSVSTPQVFEGVNNAKVISPGMFRISPNKVSKEAKKVPNTVSASSRTKPITVSQPSVITKKGMNSNSNGNLKLLINFVWKFLETVRFGNDHVAAILGFGDLQWGNILITRVYFVEGLGHNLFSVGQFCDSDLEVAFQRKACFVRNLEGVDLLKGDRLSKFKYHKEHLCPSCEQGKSKRASHPPKPVPNSRQRLHLLHMDLCGPMRIASINRKRYVFVIVDDYSRYMWVHFLRSKDEAPAVIITFLKRITVLLQSPVIIIRTDNGTEFKNQVLKVYFDSVGISNQMSSVRTPQQNRVVERRNRTLVEVARTMLIFSRAPLFLWAEAIATAWDVHLPLAEFSYNNSYHSSVRCALFEALYGRKCRSPVLWAEIKEIRLIRPELVQEGLIRTILILERIGPVAYQLRLPEELSSVHDIFHVSSLKKCLADANLHMPLDDIKIDKTLYFVEEPV